MQGLTVQGVSRDRLTPRPNENITVPDEVGRAIGARNLARQFTESRIAIALVGLGLRPAALTVRGLVRAMITTAGLARVAASLPPTVESQSTPTAVHRSDDCPHNGFSRAECRLCRDEDEEVWLGGDNYCMAGDLEVEL